MDTEDVIWDSDWEALVKLAVEELRERRVYRENGVDHPLEDLRDGIRKAREHLAKLRSDPFYSSSASEYFYKDERRLTLGRLMALRMILKEVEQ